MKMIKRVFKINEYAKYKIVKHANTTFNVYLNVLDMSICIASCKSYSDALRAIYKDSLKKKNEKKQEEQKFADLAIHCATLLARNGEEVK